MADRFLQCAIEQVADWHPNLFTEPLTVAFVAVAMQYSSSPAIFHAECTNIKSRLLGNAASFRLEVSWHNDTAEKAKRMRATMQSSPLLELASIALALILAARVLRLGKLDVTEYGSRADYRARKRRIVLEVSGTEVPAELRRRHREKLAQAKNNPFAWDAILVICAFSAAGNHIRLSKHSIQERKNGEGQG